MAILEERLSWQFCRYFADNIRLLAVIISWQYFWTPKWFIFCKINPSKNFFASFLFKGVSFSIVLNSHLLIQSLHQEVSPRLDAESLSDTNATLQKNWSPIPKKKICPQNCPKNCPEMKFLFSDKYQPPKLSRDLSPDLYFRFEKGISVLNMCSFFTMLGEKISGTICGQIWEQFSGQFFSFGIGLLDNDPINPIWIVVDLLKMALVSDKLSTSIKWSLGKTSWDDDWTNRWEWANHSKPNF